MKKIVKFMSVLVLLCVFLLTSCRYVSRSDTSKIRETLEKMESFDPQCSYALSGSTIIVREFDDSYSVYVYAFPGKTGYYEYKKPEKALYWKEEKIEDVEINSLDEFGRKIASICNPDSYCISINEFFPFVKKVFLKSTIMKLPAYGSGRAVKCIIKGSELLAEEKLMSLIKIMNPTVEVEENDEIEISLVFSSDLQCLEPILSISIDTSYLVRFSA